MQKLEIRAENMCRDMQMGPVVFPEWLSASSSKHLCHKVNGKMFLIQDEIARQVAFDLKRSVYKCHSISSDYGDVWTGWYDEPEEGKFVSMENHQIVLNESHFLNGKFWQHSEPNGDSKENCGVLTDGYQMIDDSCLKGKCPICDIGTTPIFQLRGLCEETKFNKYYGWTGERSVGEKYNFRGFSSSFLYWDDAIKLWKLEDTKNASIYAATNGSRDGYPMGTNWWYFYNDTCTNEGDKVSDNIYKVEISFSYCQENTFNCEDGTW